MTYLYNKDVNVLNANAIVSTTNPLPVTTLGGIYNSSGNLDTAKDAFGRARTAPPFTLFDSSFRYSDDSRNWNTANTGISSAVFIENNSFISMNVSNTLGDKVIRETKKVFKYQPGKSLLTLNSFVMAEGKTGLRQRVGYFSANNGHFLEQNDNTLFIVERSGTTGSPVDTAVSQSNWNVDKLDGTGPSGLSVNVANTQIFWTDTEWLGVGSVRAGFVIDGQFIISHIFHHANKTTLPYMTTATLPLRLEIENTGATSSYSQLKHICNSVISEGGYSPTAASRAVATSLLGINLSQTVFKPAIAIRLKAGREDAVVVPGLITIWGLQNNPFIYRLSMNETITGGTWVFGGSESAIEYNITATDMSGGDTLMQGLFGGGTIGSHLVLNLEGNDHNYQLRRRLDGTRETLVISILATTNNDDAVATLTWQEF
jgi:hypothetical protein